MIRSKQGKVKQTVNHEDTTCQKKKYDAVLKNYKCLFCQSTYYFENIYDSKCACGSQWFEKLQAIRARQLDCV